MDDDESVDDSLSSARLPQKLGGLVLKDRRTDHSGREDAHLVWLENENSGGIHVVEHANVKRRLEESGSGRVKNSTQSDSAHYVWANDSAGEEISGLDQFNEDDSLPTQASRKKGGSPGGSGHTDVDDPTHKIGGRQDGTTVSKHVVQKVDPENQAEVVQRVLSDAGFWSEGSKNHGRGRCRPCNYFNSREGCKAGEACTFCHLPHTGNSSGHGSISMWRRLTCKKLAALIQSRFAEDPETLRHVSGIVCAKSHYMASLTGQIESKGDDDKSLVDENEQQLRRKHIMSL